MIRGYSPSCRALGGRHESEAATREPTLRAWSRRGTARRRAVVLATIPDLQQPIPMAVESPKTHLCMVRGGGSTRRPPRGQKRRQTERRRRAEPLLVAYDGRTEAGRRAPLPGSPAGKINLCVVTECEQRGYRVAASLERLAAAEAAWY